MKLSKVFKTAIYIFIFLSLSSCGIKESPHRIGKFKVIDIKNSKFLSSLDLPTLLSCQNNYVMYDDILYTKADSNIKIGDSISIMYVSKIENYFIKENFPKNYNSSENSVFEDYLTLFKIIFIVLLFIGVVYYIVRKIFN